MAARDSARAVAQVGNAAFAPQSLAVLGFAHTRRDAIMCALFFSKPRGSTWAANVPLGSALNTRSAVERDYGVRMDRHRAGYHRGASFGRRPLGFARQGVRRANVRAVAALARAGPSPLPARLDCGVRLRSPIIPLSFLPLSYLYPSSILPLSCTDLIQQPAAAGAIKKRAGHRKKKPRMIAGLPEVERLIIRSASKLAYPACF